MLPNANEGIHRRSFAFTVPYTYPHFRQMNVFVCRLFSVHLVCVYATLEEYLLNQVATKASVPLPPPMWYVTFHFNTPKFPCHGV